MVDGRGLRLGVRSRGRLALATRARASSHQANANGRRGNESSRFLEFDGGASETLFTFGRPLVSYCELFHRL